GGGGGGGGGGGLSDGEEADRLHVEMADALALLAGPAALRVERAAVAEIGAGAERLALRRQHGGAATVVLVERLEGAGDLVDESDVEKIVGRPPDLDQGDEARPFDRDVLERTHVDCSLYC